MEKPRGDGWVALNALHDNLLRCALVAAVGIAVAAATGIVTVAVAAAGIVGTGEGITTGGVSGAAVREIPVTILTDASFRALPRWETLAREAVEEGTADLPEAVGMRFRPVEWRTWDPPGKPASLAEMLDAAIAAVGDTGPSGRKPATPGGLGPGGGEAPGAASERGGLLAVFTGLHFGGRDRREMGYAYLGRPALILVAPRPGEVRFASHPGKDLAFYFRHELGHVFGLPHMRGGNIMAARLDQRRWEFRPLALDILRAARDMDFTASRPFAGCDLETLRDAYSFLDERGECEAALLINLGVAFAQEGRPDEAKRLLEAGLRREKNSTAARVNLAQTMLSLGDTTTARALADSLPPVERLSPEEIGVLGDLRVRLGDLAEGRALLTKALASDSTRFASWFLRGLAYFRDGDFARARADFEHALSVEERPEAWYDLALACDALADRDGARRALERYLELAPDGPQSEDVRKRLERYREGKPGN